MPVLRSISNWGSA
jgi:hypothetical protein